jgi:hypothetical protein
MVMLLDGAAAGQLGVQLLSEGVQIGFSGGFQALEKIIEKALRVPLGEKVGQPANHKRVGREKVYVETSVAKIF